MDFSSIRKQLIKAAQADLPEHLQRLQWTKEQLNAFQLARLRQLLMIAKNKTPWYQKQLRSIDIEKFTLDHLHSLPILTKSEVMQHWDSLVTVPGLTRQIAENHLENLRQHKIKNPYFNDHYLFIATGGSSGVRGLFIWDLNFLKETACINYRFLIQDEIKANYSGHRKMAVIEAPTLLHGSQHLFTINVLPEIKVKSLNVVDALEKNCKILSQFQPDYLVGFASYIAALANAQLQGKINIQPRWVSTNSELLDDEMRSVIYKAWHIQPCNSWGSVEIGSVAMENSLHTGMILADDAVILEWVDNHLLATCLYNHAMPLIRYVIEDIIEIAENALAFSAYHIIKSVLGRTTDWFYYKEGKIPPLAFRDILSLSKEVEEYQIIQTTEGAIFKLICNKTPNIAEIQTKTIENLRKAGLQHPKIVIEIVDFLPKNPETGKVKRFIPLENKSNSGRIKK